jgi:hypothetical protein
MSAKHCWVLTFAAIAALVSGCASTNRLLREQELALLKSQVAQTDAALKEFAEIGNPEASSQLSTLIPATLLNSVLDKFDRTIIDPPGPELKDVRIIVEKIRTNFDAALPYVETTISACTRPSGAGECGDLKVSLRSTAYLEFTVNRTTPPLNATLHVRLVDAVPSVQVKWWQFQLQGFVRRLIKAQLAQLIAAKLPGVVVPLETAFNLAFAAGKYRVVIPGPSGGRLYADLATPGLNERVNLKVFRLLFLKDGVHLFMQVE